MRGVVDHYVFEHLNAFSSRCQCCFMFLSYVTCDDTRNKFHKHTSIDIICAYFVHVRTRFYVAYIYILNLVPKRHLQGSLPVLLLFALAPIADTFVAAVSL